MSAEVLAQVFELLNRNDPEKYSEAFFQKELEEHLKSEERIQEVIGTLTNEERQLCAERAKEMFEFDMLVNLDDDIDPEIQRRFCRDFETADGRKIKMTKKLLFSTMSLEHAWLDVYYSTNMVLTEPTLKSFLAGERITTMYSVMADGISMFLKKKHLEKRETVELN